MNEQMIAEQAETVDQFQAEIAKPDPEPELLATLAPTGWAPTDLVVAGRLLRAALRQRDTVDKLKAAMQKDAEAWMLMIAAQEARESALRRFLEAYLIATGEKIRTPFGSAYMSKRPVKLEYEEEGILDALDALKTQGVPVDRCIKINRSVIAKEFKVLVDSQPSWFKDLVKEVGGEPSITIRKG